MVLAHPDLVGYSHIHAFVGEALNDHRTALGMEEIRKSTSRAWLPPEKAWARGRAGCYSRASTGTNSAISDHQES